MPVPYQIQTTVHGCPITVTAQGQAEVEALAWKHAVCEKEGHPYTEDNPRVGLNLCLQHYLEKEQTLTRYLGRVRQTGKHHSESLFLDIWGFVHIVSTKNRTPYRDVYETLRYYNFTVPCTYRPDEESPEIVLEPSFWKLYGQVQTQSIVFAVYDRSSPKTFYEFLCVKDGPTLPVTRKKGVLFKLCREARKQIEASHTTDGYYWNGGRFTRVTDKHIYDVASELASRQLDVQDAQFLQFLQA